MLIVRRLEIQIIHKSLAARKLKGLNNIGQNLIRFPLSKEIALSTMLE
jgi:hypothetical protein